MLHYWFRCCIEVLISEKEDQKYGKIKNQELTEYRIGRDGFQSLKAGRNSVGKQPLLCRVTPLKAPFVGARLSCKASRLPAPPSTPSPCVLLPRLRGTCSAGRSLVVPSPPLSSLSLQHSLPRTDAGNRYQTSHTLSPSMKRLLQ